MSIRRFRKNAINSSRPQKYYCRSHYLEYLCFLVRLNRLETLSILKADDLETLVRRENRRMPPKPYGILEGIYRHYLAEVNLFNSQNLFFSSLPPFFMLFNLFCLLKQHITMVSFLSLQQ